MDVDPQFGKVMFHTCHCVQNEYKITDVIVCGGINWDWSYRSILSCFCLGKEILIHLWTFNESCFADVKNEPYMKIRREILLSRPASVRSATSSPRLSLPSDREDSEMMQRELEHLRPSCSKLTEEKSSIRLYVMLYTIVKFNIIILSFRNELVSAQALLQKEITLIRLVDFVNIVDLCFHYLISI